MIWLTGGLERYVEASRELADTVVKPTSIVGGPRRGHAADVALPAGIRAGRRSARWPWRRCWCPGTCGATAGDGASGSSCVWTVPPVLVYTLVHFGQAGYVLTFLPALVILLVARAAGGAGPRRRAGAERAGARRARRRRGDLIVLVNGAFFVSARPLAARLRPAQARLAPDAPSDEAFDWIFSRTAAALREHEEVVRDLRGRDPRTLPVRGHRHRHRAGQHALVPVAASRDVLPAGVRDLRAAGRRRRARATTRRGWRRR